MAEVAVASGTQAASSNGGGPGLDENSDEEKQCNVGMARVFFTW